MPTTPGQHSKAAIARAMGISRGHLYRLLAGERTPSKQIAEGMALWFGKKPADWMREPSPKGRAYAHVGPDSLTPIQELTWYMETETSAERSDAEWLRLYHDRVRTQKTEPRAFKIGWQWHAITHNQIRAYPTLRLAVRAIDRALSPPHERGKQPRPRTCAMCGRGFTPRRSDAETCGEVCRKRLSRAFSI